MGKVAYLIGAGASVGCLPIVSDIPDKLEEFAGQLLHFGANNGTRLGESTIDRARPIGDILLEMSDECKKLAAQARSHASIDTYAKKLIITGQNHDYLKLKTLLSLLFIEIQTTEPIDSRYDSFFASVLDTSGMLNPNIKIVSWNYDFQFEKAYSAYSNSKELTKLREALRVYPSALQLSKERPPQGFCICKVNGTTAFKNNMTMENPVSDFSISDETHKYKSFADRYSLSVLGGKEFWPNLSFAWEELHHGDVSLSGFASGLISSCDAIVVIGYSFPFFNREVDRKMLELFNKGKIYIQDIDPERTLRSLKAAKKIHSSISVDLLHVDKRNPDQFFLPPELSAHND